MHLTYGTIIALTRNMLTKVTKVTIAGLKLLRFQPGYYQVVARPTLMVTRLGTGRLGQPGRRYTFTKYGVTGVEQTFMSLHAACRFLRKQEVL